jgi:hypothetical protein
MSELDNALLLRIAVALEALARNGKPAEPNLMKHIREYKNFDWSSINARVVSGDRDGATQVEWDGQIWIRRSPYNAKFTPAIWYSRSCGADAEGKANYLNLITFKDFADAEAMPDAVQKFVKSVTPAPAVPEPKALRNDDKKPVPLALAKLMKTFMDNVAKHAGRIITVEKKEQVSPLLGYAFADEVPEDLIDSKKKVIKFFTGKETLVGLDDCYYIAFYTWLAPYMTDTNTFRPHEDSCIEARWVRDFVDGKEIITL